MTQLNKSIFICEDDADSSELMRFVFEMEGYTVVVCDNLEECLRQAQQRIFQAIVLDNRLGELSSVEICRKIRDIHPSLPIIFYSGEARQPEIEKALTAGADAYLIKPLDFEKLTQTVTELIGRTV